MHAQETVPWWRRCRQRSIATRENIVVRRNCSIEPLCTSAIINLTTFPLELKLSATSFIGNLTAAESALLPKYFIVLTVLTVVIFAMRVHCKALVRTPSKRQVQTRICDHLVIVLPATRILPSMMERSEPYLCSTHRKPATGCSSPKGWMVKSTRLLRVRSRTSSHQRR